MLATAEDRTPLMLYRIRGEFLEMPGLHLTLEQAVRLWRIDAATCTAALGQLVAERFLVRTRAGAYKRAEQV